MRTTSSGRPKDWQESFISEYATMHPWRTSPSASRTIPHITDTIDTVREAGLVLHADQGALLGSARHRAAGVL